MSGDDTDRIERIRERAHQIWENEGRPDGRETQHWEQASREIDAESTGQGVDIPARSCLRAVAPAARASRAACSRGEAFLPVDPEPASVLSGPAAAALRQDRQEPPRRAAERRGKRPDTIRYPEEAHPYPRLPPAAGRKPPSVSLLQRPPAGEAVDVEQRRDLARERVYPSTSSLAVASCASASAEE